MKRITFVFLSVIAFFSACPLFAADGIETRPLTVIEMFSSQACIFCPAADRLFADLAASENIIAMSCHVDYFDFKEGSLARDFCSQRQSWYMTALRAGPNYTPQFIINGVVDAVGYRYGDLANALNKAKKNKILPLDIQKGGENKEFLIKMPELKIPDNSGNGNEYAIWLALYDEHKNVVISEGYNRGHKITYVNTVTGMEPLKPWDGNKKYFTLPVALDNENTGFVLLAQNHKTGRIVAAGNYEERRE
jgi:hypothetical protein